MKNHITFSLFTSAGAPMRQFSIARSAVAGVCIIVLAIASGTIYGITDYIRLKNATVTTSSLKSKVGEQDRLIAMQRQQVQSFARDIDDLKSKLVELNRFEKKIRIIANLENKSDRTGIFGVGGTAPADLDAGIPLQQTHRTLMRAMHDQANQLEVATSRQAKSFASLLESLEGQVDLLAATPSIRPTKGWVTSRFGYRESPFTDRREFHNAFDIANREGTPILATAKGRVSYSGSKWLYGKTLVIDHGHGMITRYAHCSKLLKNKGDIVERGETIALMGNTGRSTGPHVHYEVRLNGVPVNPENYILN
jgi:murein DD-endopeptidase MepM/ murein hydrolase activator NlpD